MGSGKASKKPTASKAPPAKGTRGKAYSAHDRAKARILCEYDGLSEFSIAAILGCARGTVENWKEDAEKEGDPWIKGRYVQEMRQAEEASKRKAIEDAGYTDGKIIAEIGLIADADEKNYWRRNPDTGALEPIPVDELSEKASRALSGVRYTEYTTTKEKKDGTKEVTKTVDWDRKRYNKLDALRLLGQEKGLFKPDTKLPEAAVLNYYRDQLAARRKQ